MGRKIIMDEDRLFPGDPTERRIARRLYGEVKDLPIISPHGHTDPRWYADNPAFPDPASLFLIPDHYLFRMLYSQGVPLERLGIPRSGRRSGRKRSPENLAAFRGALSPLPGNALPDVARACLLFPLRHRSTPRPGQCGRDLRPARGGACPAGIQAPRPFRALQHRGARHDGLPPRFPRTPPDRSPPPAGRGRVVPAFRPDLVVDPEFPGFAENVARLGEITGEDTAVLGGISQGPGGAPPVLQGDGLPPPPITATRAPSRPTSTPPPAGSCSARPSKGAMTREEAELFRGQMLTEMVRMSLDDGLVDPDPSRLLAEPQRTDSSDGSAATRGPTFPCGPTTPAP